MGEKTHKIWQNKKLKKWNIGKLDKWETRNMGTRVSSAEPFELV